MRFGLFSICPCCEAIGGLYDFYGQAFGADEELPIFYRVPSVEPSNVSPEGAPAYWCSDDAGWSIAYPDQLNSGQGTIIRTISPMQPPGAPNELCWSIRSVAGAWRALPEPGWTLGADAAWANNRLVANRNLVASERVFIATSQPLNPARQYTLSFTLKASPLTNLRVQVGGETYRVSTNPAASGASANEPPLSVHRDQHTRVWIHIGWAPALDLQFRVVTNPEWSFFTGSANDGVVIRDIKLWEFDPQLSSSEVTLFDCTGREPLHQVYLPDDVLSDDGPPAIAAGGAFHAQRKYPGGAVPALVNGILENNAEYLGVADQVYSCNETEIGFYSLGSNDTVPEGSQGVIMWTESAGLSMPLDWNWVSGDLSPAVYDGAKYPILPIEYETPVGCPQQMMTEESAMSINSDTDIPIIVAVSPHHWPNCWSVTHARQKYYYRASCPDTGGPMQQWAVETVRQQVAIGFGAWRTERLQYRWEPAAYADVILGPGGTWYTVELEQDRVVRWVHNRTFINTRSQPVDAHIWANVIWADSNEQAQAALVLISRAIVTITGGPQYAIYLDSSTSGTLPVENTQLEHELHFVVNGQLVDSKTAADESEAVGADSRFHGLAVLQASSEPSAVAVFRREFSEATTAGVGWTLRVYDDEGAFLWEVTDNRSSRAVTSRPEVYASSDEFIYLRDFWLDDPRMASLAGRQETGQWRISRDGTVAHPLRTIFEGEANDAPRPSLIPGGSPGLYDYDSVKLSRRIPLTPRKDDEPSAPL